MELYINWLGKDTSIGYNLFSWKIKKYRKCIQYKTAFGLKLYNTTHG